MMNLIVRAMCVALSAVFGALAAFFLTLGFTLLGINCLFLTAAFYILSMGFKKRQAELDRYQTESVQGGYREADLNHKVMYDR